MLNFLVNTLDEEIDIELGESADIVPEDIWDVLVGCRADEDSVSHLCELERVGKTLIQQNILELLPDRPVDIVAELHLRPYYDEEYDSEEELSMIKRTGSTSRSRAGMSSRSSRPRDRCTLRSPGPIRTPALTATSLSRE
ncbi:hypothetical protein [Halococcus sp. PRR34]|uniref:hypothetical protein n=1 Tax=Halococcus sp. PRR34 TaxID=3020830 RepID=UPI002360CB5F|nr:hypothetical protein [Halococcus sp. PRR34]